MKIKPVPYTTDAYNKLYEMLFCDDLAVYRETANAAANPPWDVLYDEKSNEAALRKIVSEEHQPSRVRLLASRRLREMGVQPDHELHGVIVELGLEGGLDVLAAYRDGTARYFNYAGKVLIWETSTPESDAIIDQLLVESQRIIAHIGLWRKPRKLFPQTGMLRISFLGTDGIYFGEGPIEAMFADPLAAPALQYATSLMQMLVKHQNA